MPTKQMVHILSAELIVAQRIFSYQQPKRIRLDDAFQFLVFCTDGTIAFVRSSP